MIKVLIADDHELVRSGIEYILASDREIQVVGTVASGEEALEQIASLAPNVVLMDINMPGMGGLQACHEIKSRHPSVRLLVLSVLNDGPLPRHLLEAGIEGYLSKHSQPQEMISAIKAVSRGESYLSNDVACNLALTSGSDRTRSPLDALSQREMEVTMLTLQGLSIQSIAKILGVSPKTVCTYRYRIFEKLNISNDVELTRLAAKYGLLNNNDG